MSTKVPVIVDSKIALQIRELYKEGSSLHQVGSMFNISYSTVYRVVRGTHPHTRDLPNIARTSGRPRRKS